VDIYHLIVLNLAKITKDAVEKNGMLGWQYNTIGVSDALTMGGEGTTARYVVSRTTNHVL
jgi:dihydroxyacid dehydratase/phosphogluconate dehydratase